MAVDLSDLIDSVKREVSAPGLDQLPDATDGEYLGNLEDGFWEAVLEGFITGYTESDGIVSPTQSGGSDLSRELQQLVVFYAGFRIVRNQLRNIKTMFKASAGPVEYETQQAATILTAILKQLSDKRNFLLARLSELGVGPDGFYFDGVEARNLSQTYGVESYWVR